MELIQWTVHLQHKSNVRLDAENIIPHPPTVSRAIAKKEAKFMIEELKDEIYLVPYALMSLTKESYTVQDSLV